MRRIVAIAIALTIAVTALRVIPAQATDQLVPGKIMLLKPGKLHKVILKPVSPATFALPAPANSPLAKPWNSWWKGFGLWWHKTHTGPKWIGLGNPAGSKGYKYKGDGTLADPCKVILVKPKIVKAVCKGDVGFAPPHPGPIAFQLGATDLSDRYCAEFGGTEVKNDANGLKRKDAPAPALCASPSGAFVDDSSGLF